MSKHISYFSCWVVCGLLLIVALCFCLKRSRDHKAAAKPETEQMYSFTTPQIPVLLTSPEDRMDYYVTHYWDAYDFRDTVLVANADITEQAFANFLAALLQVSREQAVQAVIAMLDSASTNPTTFTHFIDLSEKYLYDPNSPYRNEELYIPLLQYVVASPKLDELNKIRPQYQLEMALKNRIGDVAADFTYMLADGRQRRMHALKAEYTILFFNNPDCEECRRVKEYMAASSVIERLVQVRNEFGARLAILAVYPDEDIALWRQAEYPRQVINSYDAGQAISTQRLYDLKAIPTLYLLDKDKRVLLKNVPVEQVIAYLTTLGQDENILR